MNKKIAKLILVAAIFSVVVIAAVKVVTPEDFNQTPSLSDQLSSIMITRDANSSEQNPQIAPSPAINASLTTAIKYQAGPFTISFDPGRSYSRINTTGPFRLLGPDGKTWFTDYVLFCYSRDDEIDALIKLYKFDLPAFDLSSKFPTKAAYSDLVSEGADPNTIYVVQRLIDGKPGVIGWGYLPNEKTWEYSINWYISPNSVAHAFVWNDLESENILNSIKIVEAPQGAASASTTPSAAPYVASMPSWMSGGVARL